MSLEIFNDRFRGWSPDLIAADGLRSLRHVEDAAERLLGPTPAVPAPPAAVAPGILEFAVNAQDAPALEQMSDRWALPGRACTGQGCHPLAGGIGQSGDQRPAGQFRSGVRAGAWPVHLRSGAGRAGSRRGRGARRLLDIGQVDQAEAPGNLSVPALRGIGGSLIY
ncbi:hypothetical protein [Sphingobium rhizovicinum]